MSEPLQEFHYHSYGMVVEFFGFFVVCHFHLQFNSHYFIQPDIVREKTVASFPSDLRPG